MNEQDINNNDTNNENITFFLEDLSIEELEDNNVELEKMMSEFDMDNQDFNFINGNVSMRSLVNICEDFKRS